MTQVQTTESSWEERTMLKTAPAPSSQLCSPYRLHNAGQYTACLWVSDSLVSGGKELLFMRSCENPKGRLGVLTVWEESSIPGGARSLQAWEGIQHLKAHTECSDSSPHEPNLQTPGHPG